MADDNAPVVVGVGRYTYRDAPDGGGSGPRVSLRDMIVESVHRAAADAAQSSGSAADILAAVGAVACPGTFFTGTADGVCRRAEMPQVYPNLPASVAKASGATNVSADSFFCARSALSALPPAANVTHNLHRPAASSGLSNPLP